LKKSGAGIGLAGLALAVVAANHLLVFSAEAGAFQATGAMNTGRYAHTATLLQNGKVLIAGGYDSNDVEMASAEIYDPAAGVWTETGPLHTARGSHTATLLPGGKVLVAGGWADSDPIADAELYEPATRTWTRTSVMHVRRDSHTATLLPNGKVLVVGGDNARAELYDSSTGTWTRTGRLNESRWSHTATLLSNGKVLVAGGWDAEISEVYDPAIGTWSLTGEPYSRDFATTTLLPAGKVLLVGGLGSAAGGFGRPAIPNAELFDPASGTWTNTNPLTTGGALTATLMFNGRVLVTGGLANNPFGFGTRTIANAREYNPTTGLWVTAGNMATPRNSHTATLLVDGRILISGGLFDDGENYVSLASAELYSPDTITFPAPQPTTLTDANILPNGSVRFAFTNTPGAVCHVLATSLPTLPLNYWMVLDGATEITPGQFQFTDSQKTSFPYRFYRVRFP
jgi:N-acetylneuraminic acid mutarotase